MRTQPANEGKQVSFTRHTPLATATTALTEGTNPSEVNLTATTVSQHWLSTVRPFKYLTFPQ
jgi:N4-gp56 family major capsid protein